MSRPIQCLDKEDLPCNDWKGSQAEVKQCPIKAKWSEGEVQTCYECGWLISMNAEEYFGEKIDDE